jgi:hypothetical protein
MNRWPVGLAAGILLSTMVGCADPLGSDSFDQSEAETEFDDESLDTYCGDPIYSGPNDLAPEAPLVGGFRVWYGTHPNVARVVEKYGDHELEFVYEDAPHQTRIASEVEAILRHGHTSVCFEATAAELSKWGTPLVVFPERVVEPTRQ